MIARIRHTGIVVADLDEALRFWTEVLGFEVKVRMDEAGQHIDAMMGLRDVRVTTAKLRAPDESMVELLQFHSHPGASAWSGDARTTGLTHVALTVADIDEVCAKVEAFGGSLVAPPQVSPDGNVRVTYCRGPEGLLLEVVEELR